MKKCMATAARITEGFHYPNAGKRGRNEGAPMEASIPVAVAEANDEADAVPVLVMVGVPVPVTKHLRLKHANQCPLPFDYINLSPSH